MSEGVFWEVTGRVDSDREVDFCLECMGKVAIERRGRDLQIRLERGMGWSL